MEFNFQICWNVFDIHKFSVQVHMADSIFKTLFVQVYSKVYLCLARQADVASYQ
jgi:hypothetical protein